MYAAHFTQWTETAGVATVQYILCCYRSKVFLKANVIILCDILKFFINAFIKTGQTYKCSVLWSGFKTCGILWESLNFPEAVKASVVSLNSGLFHIFVFLMQDTEQSQSRITVCLFTLVVTVLAKPEENRGRVGFCVVDLPCQRMSVIKALLSVPLSPPTQRSLSEITLCADWITAS